MKHKKSALLSALVALLLVALLAVACENEVPKKDPLPEPEKIDPASYPAVRKDAVDPDHMWDAIHYGLFTDQKTTFQDPRVKENKATVNVDYTLFIPEKINTRHPLVLVAVPSGIKASDFAAGPTGSDWIRAAEKGPHKFAVAFVEAVDGGEWNLSQSAEGRDEALAIYAVFKEINETGLKDKPWKAFYSLDKNRVSLVGYETGAAAALLSAAEFPSAWANVTLVDLPEFDKAAIEASLEKKAVLFGANTSAIGPMLNKEVALPVFLMDRDGERKADEVLKEIYDAADAFVKPQDKTDEPSLRKLEFLDELYAKDLYDTYLSRNGRYLGYPGGTIRANFELDDEGFTLHEDTFKTAAGTDRANRFLTYVPANLDKDKPVSLVLALHGMSAALTDLISECRLSVLADAENFIVCYCQAPIADDAMAPNWDDNQIPQLQHNIDWCLEKYPFIDKTRVYAMGHSMGAMSLGTNVIPNAPNMFAAYSLNGGYMGSGVDDVEAGTSLIPAIGFMAQFDFAPLPKAPAPSDPAFRGPSTDSMMRGFAKTGGYVFSEETKPVKSAPEGYPEGKYNLYDYVVDGKPIERFVGVSASPHTFMAEEAMLAWDWMKHWSKGADGIALYDGKALPAPAGN